MSLIAVTCNQNIAQSCQEGASCDLIDIIRNVLALAGWSTFAKDDVFVEKMDRVIAYALEMQRTMTKKGWLLNSS